MTVKIVWFKNDTISVMNNIIRAIGCGEVTALVVLDHSAAFEIVGHTTLLDILRPFAVDGIPLL